MEYQTDNANKELTGKTFQELTEQTLEGVSGGLAPNLSRVFGLNFLEKPKALPINTMAPPKPAPTSHNTERGTFVDGRPEDTTTDHFYD